MSLRIASQIARIIVHSYYESEHVVVLEGLLRYGENVSDTELASALSLSRKTVKTRLQELFAARIIVDLTKKDMSSEAQAKASYRSNVVQYYAFDPSSFCMHVLYRHLQMAKAVDSQAVPADTSQEYYTCQSQSCIVHKRNDRISVYEAARLMDTIKLQFCCEQCGNPLVQSKAEEMVSGDLKSVMNTELQVLYEKIEKLKAALALEAHQRDLVSRRDAPLEQQPFKVKIVEFNDGSRVKDIAGKRKTVKKHTPSEVQRVNELPWQKRKRHRYESGRIVKEEAPLEEVETKVEEDGGISFWVPDQALYEAEVARQEEVLHLNELAGDREFSNDASPMDVDIKQPKFGGIPILDLNSWDIDQLSSSQYKKYCSWMTKNQAI